MIAREKYLKRKWGLTLDQYLQILLDQAGVCGICRAPVKGNLVIDHDHRTKIIRGLLCAYCNHYILGRLTLDKARAVVMYLEQGGNYGTVPVKSKSKRRRFARR